MPSHILAALLILFSYQLRMRRKKYLDAVEGRHASFTPFVTSIDGVLAREANSVMKILATKIALKWENPLSEVTGWVRATLAFAILRATNLYIRGSRVKWRSAVHMDNGVGLLTSAYE